MQNQFFRKQFRSKSFIQTHPRTQSLHFNPKRTFAFQQFDAKKNYYKILDVSEKASQGDIKKAFYKLAKQYHPDVNKGNAEKFKEINEAYEVIGDDSKRRSYDDMRKYGSGGSSSSSSSSSYSSSKPNSGYSNTSNAYRNQGSGGQQQQHYYYYQDQNGNPYSSNSQYEETLRNHFRQWGQTQAQWKQFEEELKKKQGYYGQQNQGNYRQPYGTSSNANQAKNAYNQFSQANRNAEANKYHDYENAYRKMQEDIYKTHKDEEYRRMEEMERIRRKKEEEFMRDAEKKLQEILGKVEGAKKFVKNLASNIGDFWKSK